MIGDGINRSPIMFLRLVPIACLLSSLAALPAAAAAPVRYFAGQLELDINGETVAYQRYWTCEEKTLFRPARNDLFEKHYRQVPAPQNFVAIRSATGRAVVVLNWRGCESEGGWADGIREITIYDSADEPTYGERLYTKLGAPAASIPNPLKRSFRVRVVKDSRREIDTTEYDALKSSSGDVGVGLLNHLIQKAAYSLEVTALAWNETGKTGVRTSLTFTEDGWVVSDLRAPLPSDQIFDSRQPPPNASLRPLPLQSPRRTLPRPLRVVVGGHVVEVDDTGFGEITPTPPGLRMAKVRAKVDSSAWSSHCTLVPGPECPKPLP